MKSNYLAIMDWMLELGLNHLELTAYAIVWSFSRDGESWFQGTASYLARWMCINTKRPVLNALSSLVTKGLIEKRERWENGVHYCDYRAVRGGALKAMGVGPEKPQGGSRKTPGGGSPKALHNNTIDNGYKYPNKENKHAHMRVKTVHGGRFIEVWETLLRQPGWTDKTADALDECMRDLNAVTEDEAVEMVRRSIKNGWRGLFPLGRRSEPDQTDVAIAEADRMEKEIVERMAARAAANDIKS